MLALTIAQHGMAQESFRVSGPVAYYYNYTTGQYDYGNGATFEAEVSYDSSAALTNSYIYEDYYWYNYAYANWDNSVNLTTYTVFDSAGNAILSDEIISEDQGNTSWSNTQRTIWGFSDYYYYDPYRQEGWFNQAWNASTGGGKYGGAYWYDYSDFSVANELAELTTTYPSPLDKPDWDYGYFYGHNYSYEANHYFSGSITEVTDGNRDTDGDGVYDDADACIASDLRATVVVGDDDSKVPNTLLGNGCTILDMITLIRADESKHGKRVSGVADFLNSIRNDGVITGKQRGTIQSAVARAK
ncbi:MAG: hypothetical protein Q7V56_07510 [Gammaproteobacteria bacterium]|nr:hypothetical protein [Gammaproteobacteria bacterium]